jgi:deoxyadenosine/deoxycytidine kinase
MSRILYVEGNIGSGKSTLLKDLETVMPGALTWVPEPLDDWNAYADRETGETILEMYYKNPKAHAAFFQNVVVQSKIRILMDILKNKAEGRIYVMERSFYSDFWVFGKILKDQGLITDMEHQFLRTWFVQCESMFKDMVMGVVFMDVPVDVCHERIRSRARAGESGIQKEYLAAIHDAYMSWMAAGCADVPVLRVAEGASEEVAQAARSFIEQRLRD